MFKAWIPAFAGMTTLMFCCEYLFGTSALSGRIICVDAGHGTVDFQGHVINSGKITRDGRFAEYRLTFEIARRVGQMLEEEGAQVIYTRTPEDYWRQSATITDDNKARALLANELKADVFIAIHCDWDPRSRIHGATTYYKTKESQPLGEEIQKNLVKNLKVLDRRLRHDTFTVLDQTTMPTILIETGFLSNRTEAKKLATQSYQTKIAEAIKSGLQTFFSN